MLLGGARLLLTPFLLPPANVVGGVGRHRRVLRHVHRPAEYNQGVECGPELDGSINDLLNDYLLNTMHISSVNI